MDNKRFAQYKSIAKSIIVDGTTKLDNALDMMHLLETLKDDEDIDFMNPEVLSFAMDTCHDFVTAPADHMATTSEDWLNLYWHSQLFQAPYRFDAFCRYMEMQRDPMKRFYEPRQKTLGVVVQDLQDLEDDKIRFYGLSLPSRTGKSTLCIFFLAWVMGRHPERHNAMGGHSGILAKGFYEELLNLIETSEYTYAEIFPELLTNYPKNRGIVQKKSADLFTINLGDPDRFPTMTCRGIDGTWTGAIDISAGGYLYVDDLVRDREHSLSAVRMENTYQEYLNKMVDRMNDGAKQLMVGTLWSVLDPLERTRLMYEGNPQYRFRRIPALDEETDESNFDYIVNGFSTEYYREMRNRLDSPEWMAKYQQKPYVREGLLFPPDELRFYNGVLPEGDSRVVSCCDVAWGGGDSLSMPVGREYENGDVYIFDWIFDTSPKEKTLPKVVGRIMGNEIRQMRFEANNGGEMYAQYVDERLKENNFKCSCSAKKAPGRLAKMEKISQYAGDIKRNFVFLSPGHRSAEYQKAMDELCMTVQVGTNEHDDAADGLTQLADLLNTKVATPVRIINSPF